jgi:hypothetical protein
LMGELVAEVVELPASIWFIWVPELAHIGP